MGFEKVREELTRAVNTLALSPGRIGERLKVASIDVVSIREDDAEDFWELIEWLRGRLLAHGAAPDTVERLSEDECVEIAKEILRVDYLVRMELHERSQRKSGNPKEP